MTPALPGPIWLLSGTPGSGKTTTALALCGRYPRAIHIPVDDLRERVVAGYASPLEPWTQATTQQFSLARAAACRIATLYTDAGFAAVIDDVAREADMADYTRHLAAWRIVKVLLSPRLDTALERNRARTNKPFDTAALVSHIRRLHRTLLEGCRPEDGWIVIDTTDRTVASVVDQIAVRAEGT